MVLNNYTYKLDIRGFVMLRFLFFKINKNMKDLFLIPFRKVSVSSDKGVIAVKSCLKVLCSKNIIKH